MTENEWVKLMAAQVGKAALDPPLRVKVGLKLAYGYEILSYSPIPRAMKTHPQTVRDKPQSILFETDLAIIEEDTSGSWKPRVVVEAKLTRISTHSAITYSQKAAAHRTVHPYLRYGMMLGNRGQYPLPGRVYRHGQHFDFMISFRGLEPTKEEMGDFFKLLQAEVEASRTMEKIIYESRKRGRDRYTLLHRRLEVK